MSRKDKPMKDPDKVNRILQAAAETTTEDTRESAIVGAIASTLISTGRFNVGSVASVAAESMGWAYSMAHHIDDSTAEQGYVGPLNEALRDSIFPGDRRGYPTTEEIRGVARKFMERYNPPAAAA